MCVINAFALKTIFLTVFIVSLNCVYAQQNVINAQTPNVNRLNDEKNTPSQFEELLLGLRFDELDAGSDSVIRHKNFWFIPLEKLQNGLSLHREVDEKKIALHTPVGRFVFTADDFIYFENKLYISTFALVNVAAFEINFNQPDYALDIYSPWGANNGNGSLSKDIEPDILPEQFNVRQISAEVIYQDENNHDDVDAEFRLGGNILNGIWELDYFKPDQGDGRFTEYHYVKGTDKTQLLLGFDNISPNNLFGGVPFSGVQYAISNQPINDDSRSLDIEDFYENINGNTRTIRGQSEPGAIAQLFINGRLAEQTRVSLNGEFKFSNARLTDNEFNDVEVLIINRQRTRIIERIDYSQRGSEFLLDKGQHLAYVAAGVRGSILESENLNQEDEPVTSVLYRYGVIDDFTFELSRLDNGLDSFNSLGFSSLIFNRLEANTRVASDGDTNAYSGNLGLNGSRWRFTADSRYFEAGFRNTSERDVFEHRLDFDVYPTDRWVISLIGKDVQREEDKFSFLLPGISLYGEYYSVSSEPFNDEKYKSTLTWNKDAIYARYDYFDAENFLSFDYRFNPEINAFANARFGKNDSDIYELGLDWFPDTIDDTRSNIRASILSNADGDLGYSLGR